MPSYDTSDCNYNEVLKKIKVNEYFKILYIYYILYILFIYIY